MVYILPYFRNLNFLTMKVEQGTTELNCSELNRKTEPNSSLLESGWITLETFMFLNIYYYENKI